LITVVRTGLVGAGAVVAIVGAGLVFSLFFLPGPPTNTHTTSDSIADLGSSPRSWAISEDSVDSGSLSLSWTASGAATVQLWKAGPCAVGGGVCPVGSPIVSWNATDKGQWAMNGTIGSVYLLSATNYGTAPISFTGTLTESYQVATPSSVVPAWALIALGGLILLGIGAVAIFLGFFLAAGVYRPPRSGVQEFDPDLEEGPGALAPERQDPGEL
jgi:hypothetical protein